MEDLHDDPTTEFFGPPISREESNQYHGQRDRIIRSGKADRQARLLNLVMDEAIQADDEGETSAIRDEEEQSVGTSLEPTAFRYEGGATHYWDVELERMTDPQFGYKSVTDPIVGAERTTMKQRFLNMLFQFRTEDEQGRKIRAYQVGWVVDKEWVDEGDNGYQAGYNHYFWLKVPSPLPDARKIRAITTDKGLVRRSEWAADWVLRYDNERAQRVETATATPPDMARFVESQLIGLWSEGTEFICIHAIPQIREGQTIPTIWPSDILGVHKYGSSAEYREHLHLIRACIRARRVTTADAGRVDESTRAADREASYAMHEEEIF